MSKWKTRNYLGVFLLLLVISWAGVYYIKGGFNKVEVTLVEVENYRMIGRYFEGNYRGDTVRIIFEEMVAYLESQEAEGRPVIIYDQEPDSNGGKIKGFVGILTTYPTALPGLKEREVSASQSVRVQKDAHISMMPNPDKINELIESFASSQGVELESFNLEIYNPNNRLVVERPIHP